MSKYASLPDIVRRSQGHGADAQDTAPDVYETHPTGRSDPVVRAVDGDDAESDGEARGNDAIDTRAMAPSHARASFDEAAHSRLHAHRPLDIVDTDTLEMHGARSVDESPCARLLRLRFETDELERELAAQADASAPAPLRVLEQVRRLQARLAGVHTRVVTEGEQWASRGDADAPVASAASHAAPPHAPTSQEHLEARLTQLEQRLGTDVTDASTPLIATVARLEGQVQLLQPRHLDAIVHRAKLAVSELERVGESRARFASTADHGALAQIAAPAQLEARLEPLVPLAPALLARLQSLAPLHTAAASFASQVDALEQTQDAMQAQQAEIVDVLRRTEASLTENMAVTERNLAALEARLAAWEAR